MGEVTLLWKDLQCNYALSFIVHMGLLLQETFFLIILYLNMPKVHGQCWLRSHVELDFLLASWRLKLCGHGVCRDSHTIWYLPGLGPKSLAFGQNEEIPERNGERGGRFTLTHHFRASLDGPQPQLWDCSKMHCCDWETVAVKAAPLNVS